MTQNNSVTRINNLERYGSPTPKLKLQIKYDRLKAKAVAKHPELDCYRLPAAKRIRQTVADRIIALLVNQKISRLKLLEFLARLK